MLITVYQYLLGLFYMRLKVGSSPDVDHMCTDNSFL